MYIHEAETDNNVDVVVAPIVIKSLTLLIYLIHKHTQRQIYNTHLWSFAGKRKKLKNWFSFTTTGGV